MQEFTQIAQEAITQEALSTQDILWALGCVLLGCLLNYLITVKSLKKQYGFERTNYVGKLQAEREYEHLIILSEKITEVESRIGQCAKDSETPQFRKTEAQLSWSSIIKVESENSPKVW